MDERGLSTLVASWTRRLSRIDGCPVEVFAVAPLLGDGEERALLPLLDADERERAGRFVYPIDRAQFITRRAARRIILAEFLDIRPSELEIQTDQLGRPLLPQSPTTRFSCSARKNLALISIASGYRIGVDVEYLCVVPEAPAIVKSFFTHNEAEEFANVPDTSKDLAFLEFWTAKEAYLKAIGTGLAQALSSVEICREKQRLLALDGFADPEKAWSLAYFQPDHGAIAALSWIACDDKPTLEFGVGI